MITLFTDIGLVGIAICIYVGGIASAAQLFKGTWSGYGFAV